MRRSASSEQVYARAAAAVKQVACEAFDQGTYLLSIDDCTAGVSRRQGVTERAGALQRLTGVEPLQGLVFETELRGSMSLASDFLKPCSAC